MAEFDPVPPPLDLPAVPDVLSPGVPLNPPMVGNASPWIPVDGENRDLILASIRAWVYRSLLPWTTAWQTQLTEWEGDVAEQLDAWMVLADTYITDHAVAGLSFRTTATPIAGAGTTDAVFVVDTDLRPLTVGDLVLTQNVSGNYGSITALIDATHATVTFIGSLRGASGLSFRQTATPIANAGTTNVVLPAVAGYPPVIGELVIDTTGDGNYGTITVVTDNTHATVTYTGTLRGPQGPAGADGPPGADGIMHSVVAGQNIAIDATDPANPIITADGSFTFTNFNNLNDLFTADGNTVAPIDGAIGVVFPDGGVNQFLSAVWVFFEGEWTTPEIWLSNNLPQEFTGAARPNWKQFTEEVLNLARNTTLNMAGASIHEAVNNTHPVWNATAGEIRQDKLALRVGVIQPTSTAPSGSIVQNDDGSFTLTGCTSFEVDHWFPTLALDDTDQAVFKLSGTMATNGIIHLYLSQYNNGIDTTANYGAYAYTQKFVPGDVEQDTPGASNPATGDVGWKIASDTTDSPLVVEAIVTLKNLASETFPIIGEIRSQYYLDDFSILYDKAETCWNVAHVGGASPDTLPDGLTCVFEEAFTGTMRLVSAF